MRVCGRSLEVSYLETAADLAVKEGNPEHRTLHCTGEMALQSDVDPDGTEVTVGPAEVRITLEKANSMAWKALSVNPVTGNFISYIEIIFVLATVIFL